LPVNPVNVISAEKTKGPHYLFRNKEMPFYLFGKTSSASLFPLKKIGLFLNK
jgi:hypothetical protein